MNSKEMFKKYVLITGASSGIGLELAHQFAKNGYDLILVARRKKLLQTLANELHTKYGSESELIEKDLEEPNAAKEIVAILQRKNISIEILVNNAGFGTFGDYNSSDEETNSRMVQLNITSLMSLTRLLIPSMLKRKVGKILNVASMAAFQPGPFMAVYYASKSFVLSFSEALSSELEGTGVTVTALCPGPVPTGFQERARVGKALMMKSIMTKSAQFVAEEGYKGTMKGKQIVIPGAINNILVVMGKFMPRKFLIMVVKRIMHKREK